VVAPFIFQCAPQHTVSWFRCRISCAFIWSHFQHISSNSFSTLIRWSENFSYNYITFLSVSLTLLYCFITFFCGNTIYIDYGVLEQDGLILTFAHRSTHHCKHYQKHAGQSKSLYINSMLHKYNTTILKSKVYVFFNFTDLLLTLLLPAPAARNLLCRLLPLPAGFYPAIQN